MTQAKRRAVLEESSLDYLYGLLRPTGIECFRFTKAELIEKVLELEGKGSEPAEPAEPSEPES